MAMTAGLAHLLAGRVPAENQHRDCLTTLIWTFKRKPKFNFVKVQLKTFHFNGHTIGNFPKFISIVYYSENPRQRTGIFPSSPGQVFK